MLVSLSPIVIQHWEKIFMYSDISSVCRGLDMEVEGLNLGGCSGPKCSHTPQKCTLLLPICNWERLQLPQRDPKSIKVSINTLMGFSRLLF